MTSNPTSNPELEPDRPRSSYRGVVQYRLSLGGWSGATAGMDRGLPRHGGDGISLCDRTGITECQRCAPVDL